MMVDKSEAGHSVLRAEELGWRKLLFVAKDPPQGQVSCQTMFMDLMGSLLLVSLVVNSLSSGVPSP